MTHQVRSAIIALTGFVEVAFLAYVTLVTWLITSWFIDDAMAARMTDRDWYLLAGQRFLSVALMAGISGAMVYGVNRLVAYVTGHRASRVPRFSALAFAGIVFLVGSIAAVKFAIDKPFL